MFGCDADLAAYANWLAEGSIKHEALIHGWVFMTNHVHLLLTPHADAAVSNLMKHVGLQYVRYFNSRYARSGTLFEGRFRSCIIEADRYLLACLRYIELNPVRACMVKDPGDFHWSSFQAHGLGLPISMWTPHPTYIALADTPEKRQARYRGLFTQAMGDQVISSIRHCANTGLVLGSEEFRERVSRLGS